MTLALNRLDQFESLVQGHSYLNNVAPDYGLSMANVATLMIPRAWWEGKARNFSSMMTEQIRNQVYATGSTANFNSFNEFKRAFGDIGAVFFGGMILGLLLALLYTVYARCEGNNQLSLFYTTVLVMPFITGFSAGFFNEAALPMFCINLACYKLLVSSEGATRGKHSTADGMRMVGPLIGSRAFSLAAGAR
jgi:hypothetical protein